MKGVHAACFLSSAENYSKTLTLTFTHQVHQTSSKAKVGSDVQQRWGLVPVDISPWLPPHPFLKPKTSFPVTPEPRQPMRNCGPASKVGLGRDRNLTDRQQYPGSVLCTLNVCLWRRRHTAGART